MTLISIIYAHRNRDLKRIRVSFDSLQNQHQENFEVIFVDYGSHQALVNEIEQIGKEYSFVKIFHLPVPQVLWNKSKALNFGIKKAKGEFIFIADIDLIFHPETSLLWQRLQDPRQYFLFPLGYLGEKESQQLSGKYLFKDLKPSRFGEVNGMILTSRKSLFEVNGYDEFYHFYGAEDVDVLARLENAGYYRVKQNEKFFYHIWHPGFIASDDDSLTLKPRLKNIMRINHRHFERNRDLGITKPLQQEGMGNYISSEESGLLKVPDLHFVIPNILSHVEHFLNFELFSYKGKIVQVLFFEDDYYSTIKYRLRRVLGKQTQPYISMKQVNDMILKEILFNYRDYNYSFEIKEDHKSIDFRIQL